MARILLLAIFKPYYSVSTKVSGKGRGTSSVVDGYTEAEAATGEDSDLHGGERESSVVPRRREGARRDLLHHGSGGDRRSAITGGSSTRTLSRRGCADGVRAKVEVRGGMAAEMAYGVEAEMAVVRAR